MWENEVNTKYLEAVTRYILSLLIWVILFILFIGVGYTAYDIRLIFNTGFYFGIKTVIVDILIVLAVVEILRTVFSYFVEGRVKITLIIDTVIVIILTELTAFWFKEMDWERILMVIALIIPLSMIRIFTSKFSQKKQEN